MSAGDRHGRRAGRDPKASPMAAPNTEPGERHDHRRSSASARTLRTRQHDRQAEHGSASAQGAVPSAPSHRVRRRRRQREPAPIRATMPRAHARPAARRRAWSGEGHVPPASIVSRSHPPPSRPGWPIPSMPINVVSLRRVEVRHHVVEAAHESRPRRACPRRGGSPAGTPAPYPPPGPGRHRGAPSRCRPSSSGRMARQLLLRGQLGDARPPGRPSARDSCSALRSLRVVQSQRVSTFSSASSGPASRTYRRTAESVHPI